MLGAVGADDVDGGPVLVVGKQDALAKVFGLKCRAGFDVDSPLRSQGEVGRVLAGEGRVDDPGNPTRREDLGDLSLDRWGDLDEVLPRSRRAASSFKRCPALVRVLG